MKPVSDLEFIAKELSNIAEYLAAKAHSLSIPQADMDPLGSTGQPFRADFGPAGSDPMARFIAGVGRA